MLGLAGLQILALDYRPVRLKWQAFCRKVAVGLAEALSGSATPSLAAYLTCISVLEHVQTTKP